MWVLRESIGTMIAWRDFLCGGCEVGRRGAAVYCRGMTIAEIVAYTLFFTAGSTVLYVVLLVVEQKRGVRFGKRFRQYLDRKVEAVARRLGKNAAFVNTLYERGIDEVEKDLIDPVAKPIVETQQRYATLKTGERDITYTGKRGASPFLRDIAEMRQEEKKNKKKKRKKRRRGKNRRRTLKEQQSQQEQVSSEQQSQQKQSQQQPQQQERKKQSEEKAQPEQKSAHDHTSQHDEP